MDESLSLNALLVQQLAAAERAVALNRAIAKRLSGAPDANPARLTGSLSPRDGQRLGCGFLDFLSPESSEPTTGSALVPPVRFPPEHLYEELIGNDLGAPLMSPTCSETVGLNKSRASSACTAGANSIDHSTFFGLSSSQDMKRVEFAQQRTLKRSSSAVSYIVGGGLLLPNVDEMKQRMTASLIQVPYCVEDLYTTEGCCQQVARSYFFQSVTLFVVIINAMWLAVDTDFNKSHLRGHDPRVFFIADSAFCSFFFFEITVRFLSFRQKLDSLSDGWFRFDAALVALMVWQTWVHKVLEHMFGFSLTSAAGARSSNGLRILRIVRLSRLARMSRLVRAVPELQVLVKGIVLALRSVLAILCALILVIYIFAITFTALLSEDNDQFQGVWHSMNFLLMQVLCGFDADFVTGLLELHWFYYVLFLLFILIASLTLMNMLIGVICEVITVASQAEKDETDIRDVQQQITKIVRAADLDCDENIDHDEFMTMMVDEGMIRSLSDMGVDVLGVVDLAHLKYRSQSHMPLAEFLEMIIQLRGFKNATVKDLVDMRKVMLTELNGLEGRIVKQSRLSMASIRRV